MSSTIYEAILRCDNVSKVYEAVERIEVLKGINFTVQPGEIVAIVGESGCGKTTLLNMIGGIDLLSGGSVYVCGEDIGRMDEQMLARFRNRHLGFIFQFSNLLSDFTALENVMMPALIGEYNKKAARARALELLDVVGLSNRAEHKAGEMSGGEQQRAAIARALANRPDIILADEPTGNLDRKTAKNVQGMIWEIIREFKQTMLVVTHSFEIAKMADRVLLLEDGTATIKDAADHHE